MSTPPPSFPLYPIIIRFALSFCEDNLIVACRLRRVSKYFRKALSPEAFAFSGGLSAVHVNMETRLHMDVIHLFGEYTSMLSVIGFDAPPRILAQIFDAPDRLVFGEVTRHDNVAPLMAGIANTCGSIRVLDVGAEYGIRESLFHTITSALPNLTTLDIHGCYSIFLHTKDAIAHLFESIPKVEVLVLGSRNILPHRLVDVVSVLPSLRVLDVSAFASANVEVEMMVSVLRAPHKLEAFVCGRCVCGQCMREVSGECVRARIAKDFRGFKTVIGRSGYLDFVKA